MKISPRTRIFLVSLAVFGAMGATFGATVGAAMLTPPLSGAMLASLGRAIDFVTMAALIGSAENFLPRTRPGTALDRAPFLAVVAGRLGASAASLVVDPELWRAMHAQLDTRLPLGLLVPTALRRKNALRRDAGAPQVVEDWRGDAYRAVKRLTQVEASRILGLPQPKLSGILRGQFRGVSGRKLIDCLTSLGRDVEIVVKDAPRRRAGGRLTVVFA